MHSVNTLPFLLCAVLCYTHILIHLLSYRLGLYIIYVVVCHAIYGRPPFANWGVSTEAGGSLAFFVGGAPAQKRASVILQRPKALTFQN